MPTKRLTITATLKFDVNVPIVPSTGPIDSREIATQLVSLFKDVIDSSDIECGYALGHVFPDFSLETIDEMETELQNSEHSNLFEKYALELSNVEVHRET